MTDTTHPECTHDELQFGSGDYYLFCHACGRLWAMAAYGSWPDTADRFAPDLANKGVASQLSGHKRVKEPRHD